ncbi:Hypothetical predicted protein [Paramuricea clavata]|uniref:Uncharacterized protein n=1 Tax=Paramuricea clavata TaxID=317549 RepID=A0A7D9IY01_PARCT|nr:Hypothetical predicted protein [Paramuricea clavata]
MNSKKRSRSRSRQSSEECSVSRHKHSKRRRSQTSSNRDSNNIAKGNAMSSNPAAFDKILRQISGISEVVNNLGQRQPNLEAAKNSGRNNNNAGVANGQEMARCRSFAVLEETPLPDLDVFTTPKLDKVISDQVPVNLKQSVEIRDKELLIVQRHVLNVAALLTALRDLLENKHKTFQFRTC